MAHSALEFLSVFGCFECYSSRDSLKDKVANGEKYQRSNKQDSS